MNSTRLALKTHKEALQNNFDQEQVPFVLQEKVIMS